MFRMQTVAVVLLVVGSVLSTNMLAVADSPQPYPGPLPEQEDLATGTCGQHSRERLTQRFVLDFASSVDQVVAQGYDLTVEPADAALLERIINRVYECKPEVVDVRNPVSLLHRGIQRTVNRFDREACYGRLSRDLAGTMVRIMRAAHKCFPK